MSKTVFIVGAGASVDFGFPTGPDLQTQIRDFLRPSDNYPDGIHPAIISGLDELAGRGAEYHDVIRLAEWMSKNLPLASSIDSFLETQSSGDDAIAYLGKLAIGFIIAQNEEKCPLNVTTGNPDFFDLSRTWIGKAWSKTNRGGAAAINEKGLQDISFVTFNYDRCIEQFLYLAFRGYFRLDPPEAHIFVRNVRIEHVYGSLGSIDFGENYFPFGQLSSPHFAKNFVPRIRTYSEQVESETSDRIAEVLGSAHRVIFLGFSFARMNTRFIQEIMPAYNNLRQVHGTAYKMSNSDKGRAESWADTALRGGHPGSKFEDLEASHFFDRNYLLF